MRRFQAGDAGAFEALLRRHRTRVFQYLLRFTGDRGRAEDLLQETWLKVIGAAARWEPRARFTTWLWAVARNLALDEIRRAALRRTEPLDPPGEATLPFADSGPLPDRAAELSQVRPHLEAAIAALPEEQREVFVLREYAGLGFREIAEISGAPENTVKSRMRYALEALRARLEAAGIGPGTPGPGERSALP